MPGSAVRCPSHQRTLLCEHVANGCMLFRPHALPQALPYGHRRDALAWEGAGGVQPRRGRWATLWLSALPLYRFLS